MKTFRLPGEVALGYISHDEIRFVCPYCGLKQVKKLPPEIRAAMALQVPCQNCNKSVIVHVAGVVIS